MMQATKKDGNAEIYDEIVIEHNEQRKPLKVDAKKCEEQ